MIDAERALSASGAHAESIAARITELRADTTQEDFSVRLGVSLSTLGRYERGERLPDIEFLAKLAATTGASFDELVQIRVMQSVEVQKLAQSLKTPIRILADEGAVYRPAGLVDQGYILIPRYDVQAAAGPGALAGVEHVLDYMAFREDWVRRSLGIDPRHLVLISASGDSMEPTIRTGDLLLIDTSITRLRDDAIYVIVRNGELVVKRLQRFFRGAIAVRSDNPAYTEETLDNGEAEELRVAGRVRWIGRML